MSIDDGIDPTEENLSWLQEFHATKIRPLAKDKGEYIEDDTISPYLGYNSYSPLQNLPNIKFRIHGACNPGWSLGFIDETGRLPNLQPIDIEEKTNRIIEYTYPEKVEIESLFITAKNYFYDGFSSALYLNLGIEFFKSCINNTDLPRLDTLTSMRERYKRNNPLLTWFEEFYFSCCDGDWERGAGGGIGLIGTHDGWIFSYPVFYLELVDKEFERLVIEQEEGTIECYKQESIYNNQKLCSIFILRAHSRGLIKGLRIFKDWVES